MTENNLEQPPASKTKPPTTRRKFLEIALKTALGLTAATALKACTKEVRPDLKPIHLSFASEDKCNESVKLYEDFTEVIPGTALFFETISDEATPSDELNQVVIQYDPVAPLYVRNMGIMNFRPDQETERIPGEILDNKIYQLSLNDTLENGAHIHEKPLKMHDISERVGRIETDDQVFAIPVITQLENWMGDTAEQPPSEKNKTPHRDSPDISRFGKGWAIIQLTEVSKNNFIAIVKGYINDARVCQPQSAN